MKDSPKPASSAGDLLFDAGQELAITADPRPLRINAGAGSGKTTVIAHRVAKLITEHGYRADQILGLTFSNKAAENLRRKIVDEVGGGLDVHVSTYHGFGASIVTDFAEELGFERSPVLIDKAQAFALLYGALNEVELRARAIGRPSFLIAAALRLGSQCADHLVSIDEVVADCDRIVADNTIDTRTRESSAKRRDLAAMLRIYESAKRARGLIDFGDQIALAVQALIDDPGAAARIRERMPVVLLDEYQDTNFAQRRLLQLIYPPNDPVTVVGDDMQSIYAFRGAHIRNLLDFENHFGAGVDAQLVTNYRSGSNIVSLANAVASAVTNTLPKKLQPRTDAASDRIEAFVGADDTDEAEKIAAWIARQGPPWSEVAILGRKRKIFPVLADALHDAGIPVEIVGIGGLLSRPEIVDVVAWLEVLAVSDANVAVLRLLRSPIRNVGLNDLALLARHASRCARERHPGLAHPDMRLLEGVEDIERVAHLSPVAWARLKQFGSDRSYLQRQVSMRSLPALIELIIDIERLSDRVDLRGEENLFRFLDLAASFSPLDGTPSVQAFLQYLAMLEESEDEPAEASTFVGAGDADSDDAGSDDDGSVHDVSRSSAGVVRIMSIHQAKGLEFRSVVVAGLSGGGKSRIFPDDRNGENGATQSDVLPLWLRTDHEGFTKPPRTKRESEAFVQLARDQRAAEELRLLYVALTRAKEHLLCTGALWYLNTIQPQTQSKFYDLVVAQKHLVTEIHPRPQVPEESPDVARRMRRAAAAAVQAGDQPAQTDTSKRSTRRKTDPGQTSLLADTTYTSDTSDTSDTSSAAVDGGSNEPPFALVHELPVSAVVSAVRCPQQFAWTYVTPLPRRPRRASATGTAVHAVIENTLLGRLDGETHVAPARGNTESNSSADNASLAIDNTDLDPDLDADSDLGLDADSDPGLDAEIAAAFLQSGLFSARQHVAAESPGGLDTGGLDTGGLATGEFGTGPGVEAFLAERTIHDVEVPFSLQHSGVNIVGRIDAVLSSGETLEIVDWKTGNALTDDDPAKWTQLDLYALAAQRNWGVDPAAITTSYVYIRPNAALQRATRPWSAELAEKFEHSLTPVLNRVQRGPYPASAGSWCASCDFVHICPAASALRLATGAQVSARGQGQLL